LIHQERIMLVEHHQLCTCRFLVGSDGDDRCIVVGTG
jgi:hypothetical protein